MTGPPAQRKRGQGQSAQTELVSSHIREDPGVVITQQSPASLWDLEPVCSF